MVASRPTVMAPPRSHAPPRAFLAHFNAQKLANARLKHPSGSRLTLRSKTAQARRSLTATQELRDTFATIDIGGTWVFRRSPARARPARPRAARAADRRVAPPVGATKLHTEPARKRAVPLFPTFHAFSTWIPAFRETRDCARAAETLQTGFEKSREKESSWFLGLVLAKGKIERWLFFAFFATRETPPRRARRRGFVFVPRSRRTFAEKLDARSSDPALRRRR